MAARGGRVRPLCFHTTHSSNIVLDKDNRVARREASFCKGICFTHRHVKVGEWVFVKILEKCSNWNGAVRLGFTSVNPDSMSQDGLPKTACPDLTQKPGYWAKATAEEQAVENMIYYFYVNDKGDIIHGVNPDGVANQDRGKFMGGVDISKPLWALLDVYGSTVSIELIEGEQTCIPLPAPEPTTFSRPRPNGPHGLPAHLNPDRADGLYASFTPVPFHDTRGQNLFFEEEKKVAVRNLEKFRNGYCFLSRPLGIEEKLFVYVESVTNRYEGGLAYGMTNCDPARLEPEDLPDDADFLLDRMEYWVVNKAVCPMPKEGDELCFHLTDQGEVRYTKNGRFIGVLMHVDHMVDLWPFLDLYGRTHKLRCLGVIPAPPRPEQTLRSAPETSSSLPSMGAGGDTGDLDDKNACTICFERELNCTLYPCGHMCMCHICAMEIKDHQNALCPICRKDIIDVIRVYRA